MKGAARGNALRVRALVAGICAVCLGHPAAFKAQADVAGAYRYLDAVMDQYHEVFCVLQDHDSGANHGFPSGWMGNQRVLSYTVSTNPVCWGRDSVRIAFTPRSDTWAGIYFQSADGDWGTVPNGGYDLRGATRVRFVAWGAQGGERVEFFAGGIEGQYGDSFPKTSLGYISLGPTPQQYELSLVGQDLHHVVGLFGFVLNTPNNPSGATFYLDEVRYDYLRPATPRFLASYVTLPSEIPDRYIHNACFTYDQALVLLTYLARGTPEDMRRAGLLADAFVFALNHDRHYSDGRLRNAYMRGDLADHMTGKARLPGWWDSQDEVWYEDEYQVSTYSGNMAWAMIALLGYYQRVGGDQYLAAAQTMGEWIENHCRDTRGTGGYTGGCEGWEPSPSNITWKSTEHNLDIYVAFTRLYRHNGRDQWLDRAASARNFVTSMWNQVEGHFWTGTLGDGMTINTNVVPLDVQAWAIMALVDGTNYAVDGMNWAVNNCLTTCHGFRGFDFNADRDGVWPEGTAHMILAYLVGGYPRLANVYANELRGVQASASRGNGNGIVSACHDGLTTGFDWEYFNRLHVGATAWYAMAEQGYNPYWSEIVTTTPPGIWSDAVRFPNGWKSNWLGTFNDLNFPWIYHVQHRYMYAVGRSPESVCLYSLDGPEWLWTSQALHPWFYRFAASTWVYYLPESSSPRWFYNWSAQRWEARQ